MDAPANRAKASPPAVPPDRYLSPGARYHEDITSGDDISTGHLPSARQAQAAVDEAYRRYRSETSGLASQVYPALGRMPGHLFGICVAGIDGGMYRAGDSGHEFTIMSVAKPLVFALVCDVLGAERVRHELGVNATGLAFDSLASIERSADGRSNPMVNAGAIAATSLAPGESGEEKCRIYWDPAGTVDLYTRQSCLLTSAEDLAVMTATLADGGVNPVTGVQVVTPDACQHALAVMATAGMCETSGDWLFDVGVPGKSGIGGGIIAVSPGRGGLGAFSPLLDPAGNSVRGQLAARHLSRTLGLSLFASKARRLSLPRVLP